MRLKKLSKVTVFASLAPLASGVPGHTTPAATLAAFFLKKSYKTFSDSCSWIYMILSILRGNFKESWTIFLVRRRQVALIRSASVLKLFGRFSLIGEAIQ